MKERQRWQPEEDALLHAYVKHYGPRDWHLVSQRMNKPLNRDAKSCLERWKNYLKPGIKKGPLSEEEQLLVIHLQSVHGNKWKKIASEVPGRTAKRLGKWWEVFKEKQEREELKESKKKKILEPIEDQRKYNQILETFAEKLVQERVNSVMATSNGGFMHSDQPATSAPPVMPSWLTTTVRPSPSPSVTLTLSPLTAPPAPQMPWLQNIDRGVNMPYTGITPESPIVSELVECCRELEEGQRAWAGHRKEAAWRLKRVELQLESEKACRRREKIEEIEAKVKALKEEERLVLDRIEGEYREQLAGLRREAEVKEQKLAEQWAAKHNRLTKFLEQMGCRSIGGVEPNGR